MTIFQPGRRAVLKSAIYVVCASILFLSVQAAFALSTVVRCDPAVKYGCTYVAYTNLGAQWRINDRNWQGAIDGGAKKWQMYWIKDWELIGGAWTFREKWGESGWRTDATLSPWFAWAGDERDRLKPDTIVQFKFRYFETTPQNPNGYYWCSGINEHYLSNGSSAFITPATCTG